MMEARRTTSEIFQQALYFQQLKEQSPTKTKYWEIFRSKLARWLP
jgi:hypothetical protein